MNLNGYQIHPDVLWCVESENRVRILKTKTGDVSMTTAFETCVWQSIWQGFPLEIWKDIERSSESTIEEIIERWCENQLLEKNEAD